MFFLIEHTNVKKCMYPLVLNCSKWWSVSNSVTKKLGNF